MPNSRAAREKIGAPALRRDADDQNANRRAAHGSRSPAIAFDTDDVESSARDDVSHDEDDIEIESDHQAMQSAPAQSRH